MTTLKTEEEQGFFWTGVEEEWVVSEGGLYVISSGGERFAAVKKPSRSLDREGNKTTFSPTPRTRKRSGLTFPHLASRPAQRRLVGQGSWQGGRTRQELSFLVEVPCGDYSERVDLSWSERLLGRTAECCSFSKLAASAQHPPAVKTGRPESQMEISPRFSAGLPARERHLQSLFYFQIF
jgi:hypothetical protein